MVLDPDEPVEGEEDVPVAALYDYRRFVPALSLQKGSQGSSRTRPWCPAEHADARSAVAARRRSNSVANT